MREAQTAGKLHHPAIVGVHSLGVEAGTPYYSMEHVEGETLASIILVRSGDKSSTTKSARSPIFAPGESSDSYYTSVAKLFARVAEGLSHAHREGVVHRDIKPSNLMLDVEGRLRILDFGLAYFDDVGTLTLTGEVVGTPFYMSPEQARRETIPVDHRTDIYSLGATLYEILTLTPPFRGRDRLDTLRMVIQSDPASIRAHDPFAPRDLETIVLKCMRKNPNGRYSTAEALAQDLTRFVKGEPIEAKPEGKWVSTARRVHRHSRSIFATTVVLVAIVTVAWLAVLRSRAETERRLALYPSQLREAVAKMDSGRWVLRSSSPPVEVSAIDFRLFEPRDFQDVIELGGKRSVREAIAELEQLTESCPTEPEAHFQLARAFLELDRRDEAIAALDRALEVDPEFVAADGLRRHLDRESSKGDGNSRSDSDLGWIDHWQKAQLLLRLGHHDAEKLFTKLIERFEREAPPYTGFLTECYLDRAKIRLRKRAYDLAEEDCVRARQRGPSTEGVERLLGTAYLAAGKPDLAEHTFERLEAHSKNREVLPFWIVSAYLTIPDCDLTPALDWAAKVRDVALKERLTTYLQLRLGNWAGAVVAGRRAVDADPEGLVARQLLATSLVRRAFDLLSIDPTDGVGTLTELAHACRQALEIDLEDRRSKILLREAWEVLASYRVAGAAEQSSWTEARVALHESGRRAGIELSIEGDGASRELRDEFTSPESLDDGVPLDWRLMTECCPARVEQLESGLRVTRTNPKYRPGGWLVTEEVFSGDVALEMRVDVGEYQASATLHVDLGSVSLYLATIQRDGELELIRFDHGRPRRLGRVDLGKLDGYVQVELRSVGKMIECRVWPDGSERPEKASLAIEDSSYRLGSVGIGSDSHPATFRWLRVAQERLGG